MGDVVTIYSDSLSANVRKANLVVFPEAGTIDLTSACKHCFREEFYELNKRFRPFCQLIQYINRFDGQMLTQSDHQFTPSLSVKSS
jgi:hypothetical protein